MRAFILFVCLLVCLSGGCLAQRPRKCRSPPLLTGSLTVSTQNEKLFAFAKYSYDALGQRVRLKEIGSYNNKTFCIDVLLLYRQGVMYEIHKANHTCRKRPLNVDFQPMAIPQNATLLGQAVLGSSSGPGQGLLVNTWVGELQLKKESVQYMTTVTEFGCIPIGTYYHTNQEGWIVNSFFNNVIGIEDPNELLPPPYCKGALLEDQNGEDPVTFFSLF